MVLAMKMILFCFSLQILCCCFLIYQHYFEILSLLASSCYSIGLFAIPPLFFKLILKTLYIYFFFCWYQRNHQHIVLTQLVPFSFPFLVSGILISNLMTMTTASTTTTTAIIHCTILLVFITSIIQPCSFFFFGRDIQE